MIGKMWTSTGRRKRTALAKVSLIEKSEQEQNLFYQRHFAAVDAWQHLI
jgi:hypothetical protein